MIKGIKNTLVALEVLGVDKRITDLEKSPNRASSMGNLKNKVTGVGVATLTVGTTQPTSPAVGDLWVDTN